MKPVPLIVVLFLVLIAVMHLLRLIFQVEVIVAGTVLPMWMSLIGGMFTALLAVLLWRENKK
ncbi:MAG: hypothetical protein KKB30_02720 [Proteobacteria bacterium]|nr:hypothetical protein [Pseudomonadota bacterium]MBU1716745.1 hypothetical protein [Pseudomonadota bacterium]